MSSHILFDTDGVLVHAPMWSEEYARRTGLDLAIMNPFFSGVFRDCTIGKADLKEVIIPYLTQWGWTGSADAYLRSWFDFENQPGHKLIEKIQKLRKDGILCYVATNQEKYRLEYLKKEMNFENLFDGIFCSAEMGVKKPDAAYYKKIIDILGVPPNEITYYDDANENVEAAKKLGIISILYTSGSDFHFNSKSIQ